MDTQETDSIPPTTASDEEAPWQDEEGTTMAPTIAESAMNNGVDLDLTNKVLGFFARGAVKNWMKALKEVESDSGQVDAVVIKVHEILDLLGRDNPVGAFVGSTASAKSEFEDGEAVAVAIRTLKEQYRLFQVGRGRGKLILVLDDTPVGNNAPGSAPTREEGSEPTEQAPSAQPAPSRASEGFDADRALRQVRDNYLNMEREASRLRIENEDLQIQLETANRRVSELYAKLDAEATTTDW